MFEVFERIGLIKDEMVDFDWTRPFASAKEVWAATKASLDLLKGEVEEGTDENLEHLAASVDDHISAERSEVQQFMESYDGRSWLARRKRRKRLRKSYNPDEAKACLLLMAQNNELEINNSDVWQSLMRFQPDYEFDLHDEDIQDVEFKSRLASAIVAIWDEETLGLLFPNLAIPMPEAQAPSGTEAGAILPSAPMTEPSTDIAPPGH